MSGGGYLGRLLRLATIALILFGLPACSGFRLLYSFADTYIIDAAESYLDPDDAEQQHIEIKTQQFLAWHTRIMLPRYARYLSLSAKRIEAGTVDRDWAATRTQDARELLSEVVFGAAPFAADVLVRYTSPAKIERLSQRLDERLAEQHEKMASPRDERRAQRQKRIAKNFERFTGPLEKAQLAVIESYVAASADAGRRWLETRAKRQRAFLDFLSQQPDEARIATFIPQILLHGHEIVDPEYGAITERRWTAIADLIFGVLSTLDAEQRRKTVRSLRDYAADMRKMAS